MTKCPACHADQPHAATCTACGYDLARHVRENEEPFNVTETMYRDHLLRLNRLQKQPGT